MELRHELEGGVAGQRAISYGAPLRVQTLAPIVLWLVLGLLWAGCTGEAGKNSSLASPTPAGTSQAGIPRGPSPSPQESTPRPEPAGRETGATSGPAPATPVMPLGLPPPSGETWELTFERAGGFAGVAQRLTADSEGQVTFEDMRSGHLTRGQLSPQEAADLQYLLEGSDFYSQDISQSTPCSDCFNYGIRLKRDGRSHSVTANDPGLDPRLGPLVQWLTELVGKRLGP